LLYTSYS